MKEKDLPKIAFKNLTFLDSPDARTLRILSEYIEPLNRLKDLKVNSMVFFLGSSKADPDKKDSLLTKYYWEAEELAYELATWAIKLDKKGKNFVVCTGGGPGIMEAANRGASRAGGKSIGMNISLPEKQIINDYISSELSFIFHYFFMRKFWMLYEAKAVIAFPGGFGTLDEIFETLTLVQTNKIDRNETFILLYGEEYWRKIIDFENLLRHGTITKEDLGIFSFSSTPKEAFSILKERLIKFL